MIINLKGFYLNTLMKCFEHIKLKMSDIPKEIVREYNLHMKKTTDGHVYIEVRKGIYSLP